MINDISVKRIKGILDKFASKRILVVGDVMLDRYVIGTVERISPEAPVPVVLVTQEYSRLGGAANVALNIRALGGCATIAGAIGDDEAGKEMKALFASSGIDTGPLMEVCGKRTTIKTRIAAGKQQIARVDKEDSWHERGKCILDFMEKIDEAIKRADAVIIEDYGKGVVSQKVVDRVISACKKRGIGVSLDPKYNKSLRIKGLRLATPNYKEACFAAGVEIKTNNPIGDGQLSRIGRILQKKWDVELLIITLGPYGMFLFDKKGRQNIIPTRAKEVYDVSGAGDTVIAAATLAIASEASDYEAASIANYAAGVVVGKFGTATCSPPELLECMKWNDCMLNAKAKRK